MITKRGDTFYLYKRVPRRYKSVDHRSTLWMSLATDSESEAKRKAPEVWDMMIGFWERRLAGEVKSAEIRYEAARNEAARRGFKYLPAKEVAALPLEERIARTLDAAPYGVLDSFRAEAVLGGVAQPPITISRALELFWDLSKDRVIGKSEDQLRRWKNPRKKAITNLIAEIGDKPIAEITADDMIEFRQWWIEKLANDGLTANSANKDFTYISDTLKTVNKMKRLNLVLPLTDLSVKEGEKRTRPPFSEKWIKTKLLAPGALDALNTEARCILVGMINTGYRPSEAAGLLAKHIHLEGALPYISIEPEGRQLKNATSKRIIPLTGVSLEAFKECPKGFPRYRENSATLTATIGKFLRENGLLETPDHSLYGLRHSFEDRLLANGVDERIRCDLFGHALKRERYGKGASLQQLHDIVSAVAII
jgi:integrase